MNFCGTIATKIQLLFEDGEIGQLCFALNYS